MLDSDVEQTLTDLLAAQIQKEIDDELIAMYIASIPKEYVLSEEYQAIFTAIQYVKGIIE